MSAQGGTAAGWIFPILPSVAGALIIILGVAIRQEAPPAPCRPVTQDVAEAVVAADAWADGQEPLTAADLQRHAARGVEECGPGGRP